MISQICSPNDQTSPISGHNLVNDDVMVCKLGENTYSNIGITNDINGLEAKWDKNTDVLVPFTATATVDLTSNEQILKYENMHNASNDSTNEYDNVTHWINRNNSDSKNFDTLTNDGLEINQPKCLGRTKGNECSVPPTHNYPQIDELRFLDNLIVSAPRPTRVHALFCVHHKKVGMINVFKKNNNERKNVQNSKNNDENIGNTSEPLPSKIKKKCSAKRCYRVAFFKLESDPLPVVCVNHKSDGMIKVASVLANPAIRRGSTKNRTTTKNIVQTSKNTIPATNSGLIPTTSSASFSTSSLTTTKIETNNLNESRKQAQDSILEKLQMTNSEVPNVYRRRINEFMVRQFLTLNSLKSEDDNTYYNSASITAFDSCETQHERLNCGPGRYLDISTDNLPLNQKKCPKVSVENRGEQPSILESEVLCSPVKEGKNSFQLKTDRFFSHLKDRDDAKRRSISCTNFSSKACSNPLSSPLTISLEDFLNNKGPLELNQTNNNKTDTPSRSPSIADKFGKLSNIIIKDSSNNFNTSSESSSLLLIGRNSASGSKDRSYSPSQTNNDVTSKPHGFGPVLNPSMIEYPASPLQESNDNNNPVVLVIDSDDDNETPDCYTNSKRKLQTYLQGNNGTTEFSKKFKTLTKIEVVNDGLLSENNGFFL